MVDAVQTGIKVTHRKNNLVMLEFLDSRRMLLFFRQLCRCLCHLLPGSSRELFPLDLFQLQELPAVRARNLILSLIVCKLL